VVFYESFPAHPFLLLLLLLQSSVASPLQSFHLLLLQLLH
jgi:hypothetical protein